MIIARIESLILERGMEDALERAFAFVGAGADGIMIHSRKPEPDEIFEFVEKFRSKDQVTPIVVVPTSFNQVTEEEFKARACSFLGGGGHRAASGCLIEHADYETARTMILNAIAEAVAEEA